jgi:hypothetical protein
MYYSYVTKAGRSRTGSDFAGFIVHIVEGKEQNGFWGTPALCGATPGRKGFGWLGLSVDNLVNVCSKCSKRSASKE